MANIVRGKLLRSDVHLYDGVTRTGSRIDATGGTLTGLNFGDEIDVLQVFGDGTSMTPTIINNAVSRIAGSDRTFRYSTGTWTIDSDLTIPSNVFNRISAGCVFSISAGITLTFSGPVHADKDISEFTTGSGTVVLSVNSIVAGKTYIARTALEIAAGVTPTNYTDYNDYPGDIRRYGGGVAESSSTNDTAIANALLCNLVVTIPYEGDGSYDVSASFTLGLWGQEVRGERLNEPVSQADEGVCINVVSGFPTAGGDAAQSVFVPTDRYQKVKGLAIDCNGIAAHALYLTWSAGVTECAFGEYSDLWILSSNGDSILCTEGTWMNTFRKVRVSFPLAGWGWNFDTTTGGGHTTTVLEQCYAQDNISTGTGLGGFRFDKCLGFSMSGCAGDAHPTGYTISLTGGSQIVCSGWDQETSVRAFEVDDTESWLFVVGARFEATGDDSSPPADIFTINGGLTLMQSRWTNDASTTVFMIAGAGARVDWYANTRRLLDETNTLNASAQIRADNQFRPSGSSTAVQRFEVLSSTPKISIHETDASADAGKWEFRAASEVFSFIAVNDSYASLGTAWSVDRNRDITFPNNVNMTGIPTSDPLVAGQLWNNSGVLTVSSG